MVSITAFRSFFVVDGPSSPNRESPGLHLHLCRIGLAEKKTFGFLRRNPDGRVESLPTAAQGDSDMEPVLIRSTGPKIPGGNMTGMRSALDRAAEKEGMM